MQIVIDISDGVKDVIDRNGTNEVVAERLWQATKNGIPLSKVRAEVFDKIRAEILEEREWAYADFEQYKIDYLGVDAEYVEDELPQDDFRYGMERCVEIIDKYKAESEDKK